LDVVREKEEKPIALWSAMRNPEQADLDCQMNKIDVTASLSNTD
jgi:hypothetical protein